jgi:putative peptide zinc metalloprotease protein
MSTFARLRTDLVAVPSEADGATVYTIKDPITGSYFRLREPEYWLIQQLDGERSPSEVASLFQSKYQMAIGAEAVEQFIAALGKLYFLEDGRSEVEIAKASLEAKRKQSLAARVLFIKLKAYDPSKLIERLFSYYRPFHRPFWFFIQFAVILLGMVLLSVHAERFAVRIPELFNIASIVTVVAALFLMISLHEFAHALVCRYHGGKVREMGFLLMYFQPCFYCDVSDAWLFKEKSQRLAVTWAGPYFQFFFLAIAVIVWRVTVPGTGISEFARICAIVAWVNFLFNFNPLIKLDGYYLLSDWLEIPNLRQRAFGYMGNVLKRHLLGWPVEPVTVTSRQRKIFLIYAILAFLYSAGLIVYVVWLVGEFMIAKWGGAGFLLMVLALAVIFKQTAKEAARGTRQHFRYMKRLLQQPVRLTIYSLLLLAVIFVCGFIKFPHRVVGDVVVRPMSEFSLATSADGLLETYLRHGGANPEKKTSILKLITQDVGAFPVMPRVKEGQMVKIGDTLAVIASNTVDKDLQGARSDLQRLQDQLTVLRTQPKREEIAAAQADVRAAQATYDQALRDLNRVKELASRDLVAANQLESVRSASDVAKASLENKRSYLALLKSPPRPQDEAVIQRDIEKQLSRIAFFEAQLGAQVILSPIDGVVSVTRNENALLTVSDNQVVELLVPVSDFDINLIATGQPVKVKVRSFSDTLFYGTVVRVPKATSDSTEAMHFPVAVAVFNAAGALTPGMTGYAKIEVGERTLAERAVRKLMSVVRVEFWSWWLW